MSILGKKKTTIKKVKKVIDLKPTVTRKSLPTIDLLPVVAEKAVRLQQLGQYTFKVKPNVTKIDVKKAVETIYGVRVMAVNSKKLPRKTVTRGRTIGQTRLRKYMVVRLAPGATLELTKTQ